MFFLKTLAATTALYLLIAAPMAWLAYRTPTWDFFGRGYIVDGWTNVWQVSALGGALVYGALLAAWLMIPVLDWMDADR